MPPLLRQIWENGTLMLHLAIESVRTRLLSACALAALLMGVASPAAAATLFWEDFDGYTSFPCQYCGPGGTYDPANTGIPEISEGADEFWYGGRFEFYDNGTINQDIAVQEFGGSGNPTPVGRIEDEAGLLFKIDPGFTNLQIDFDWRLFSAGGIDRLVVGYHLGDDLGFDTGANRLRDFFSDDFGGNIGLGGSHPTNAQAQADAENWWATEWTQLLRDKSNSFLSESFALPDTTETMWLAFWLDNGEGDYAKIDNIHVTGDAIPEPATLALLALGLVGLGLRRSR